MPRNKITDLNNHLFAQLERLGDEELTTEELETEIKRAKAISSISGELIKSAKVTLEAAKLVPRDKRRNQDLPMLDNGNNESNNQNPPS